MFKKKIAAKIGISAALSVTVAVSCVTGFAQTNYSRYSPLSKTLYQADFENATLETVDGEDGGSAKVTVTDSDGGTDTWTAGTEGSYTLGSETTDGTQNSFLSLQNKAGIQTAQLFKTFTYGDTMEIRVRMKMNEGNNKDYSLLSLRDSNGSTKIALAKIFRGSSQGWIGLVSYGNNDVSSANYAYCGNYTYGEWLDLRFVIKNISGQSDTSRVTIDAYIGDEKKVSAQNGSKWNDNTNFLSSNVRQWTKLYLMNYSASSSEASGAPSDFDDISVKEILSDEVYSADFENGSSAVLSSDNKTLTITDESGNEDAWTSTSGEYSIPSDNEDNYFLRIKGTSTKKDPQIFRTLTYNDALVIQLRMKLDESEHTGDYSLLSLRDTKGSTKIALAKLYHGETQGWLGVLANGNKDVSGSNYKYISSYTYGEWVELKFVIKNINGQSDTSRIAVDGYVNGEKKFTDCDGTIWSGDTNFLSSKVRNWTRLYIMNNNGGTGAGADVDDISVISISSAFTLKSTSVQNNSSYVEDELSGVTAQFNYPIDTDTKNNITLTDSAGNGVNTSITWNADGDRAEIAPASSLEKGTYTLDFSGVKDVYGRSLSDTSSLSFTVVPEVSVDGLYQNDTLIGENLPEGEVSAKVSFANHKSGAEKAVAVVALYENKCLKGFSLTDIDSTTLDRSGESKTVTTRPVNIESVTDNTSVRVFVWDSMQSILPLGDSEEY